MQSRIATGTINKLSGEPWPHARVHFELVNNVLESCDFAPSQCLSLKANSDGLIEVSLLVGGTYKMALTDGQLHEFTVAAGAGSFCLWDAVVAPPAEDYPWFVRVDGDTMEGDLDFAGNEIQGARIGPSNVIQSPVLSDRPVGLEPGQVAYSADGQTYWLGIGTNESYGVDGSQVIPSPPAGKGWREFSLFENGGPNGNSRSVSRDVADADLVGNLLLLVHGLGTNVVDVSVRDASGNAVFVENHILSANAVSLSFEGLRPLANPYTVLVEA